MIDLHNLKDYKVLVMDIESDGLLDTITKVWTVCAKDYNSSEVFEWTFHTGYDGLQECFNDYDYIVGHNFIGFDVPALKAMMGLKIDESKIIDTLVLSRLANPSREGGHSLKAWGEELGNHKGDYDDWSHLNQDMIDYCHQDVDVNINILKTVVQELSSFSQESIQLEHDVQWIIQQQIRNGVYFDEQKAYILLGKLLERRVDLENQVHDTFIPLPSTIREVELKYKKDGKLSVVGIKAIEDCLDVVWGPFTLIEWPEFNLGSRQQIAARLVRAGWKPKKFTEKGNIIVDEDVLEHVKGIPEAELIKEYMLVNKRVAQLNGPKKKDGTGGGWLSHLQTDNRIHGNVNSCGAVTGRMTHSGPNMAQVPAVYSPYGEECRELFMAPKGYVIVGCDASGLELRMLAHYMGDAEYTDLILNGDIHTVNQEAAGLPTRDNAKTFIYGFLYGAGDAKIGEIVGKGAKVGKKLKAQFLENTPALADLRDRVLKAAERGFLKGLDGRKLWVRSPHAALNVLLQGAGAIVMKKALEILDTTATEAGLDYKFVLNVHDEYQAEVKEDQANAFGELAVDAIVKAGEHFNMRCALDGEYKVGKSWKETH